MKKTKTGAELILHALKQEKVRAIFGYPGGQILDVFDKLYDFDIPFFLTRHEQGAIHAADGYARASGEVGVCFATSGPGATNLITGLATANMDSVPIVAITGQVPSHLIGNDAFQEALVSQMIETFVCAVSLSGGIHEGQVFRRLGIDIAIFERNGDFLGKSNAHKAACGNGVSIADNLNRFLG